MSIGDAAAFANLSPVRERRTFGPFVRYIAPSALLAGLLTKFSLSTAPDWHIQATAWVCAQLYLYFLLGRTAFVRSHCLLHGKEVDRQTIARAEAAFAAVFRARRARLLMVAAALMLGGAVFDVAFNGATDEIRFRLTAVLVMLAVFAWALAGPQFLLTHALWAQDGTRSFTQCAEIIRRHLGRIVLPWVALALAIVVMSVVLGACLYPQFRHLVIVLIPVVFAVYFGCVLFLTVQIALVVWLQAAYAAWMVQDLRKIAGLEAEQEGRLAYDARLAKLGVLASAPPQQSDHAFAGFSKKHPRIFIGGICVSGFAIAVAAHRFGPGSVGLLKLALLGATLFFALLSGRKRGQ